MSGLGVLVFILVIGVCLMTCYRKCGPRKYVPKKYVPRTSN